MRVTFRVAAILGALAALLAAIYPAIDPEVSELFYSSATRTFPLQDIDWIEALRWVLMRAPHVVTLIAVLSLGGDFLGVRELKFLPTRSSVFLLSTLIFIPGLLVNATLKEHWDRPRPAHTVEFGGTDAFQPWWQPGGPCHSNCSFVSGEVSTAAWLVAAASIAPPTIRPVAIAAAVGVTAVVAVLRVASGRHFFSDVVLGAMLTFLLVALAHRLFFGRNPSVSRVRSDRPLPG